MSVPEHRLVLTRRAQSDARSIQVFSLQQWGAEQAAAYDEAINRALEQLRAHPLLGRPREELRPGLRGYPVEQHVILYRVEGNAVIVQRILHGRQSAVRLFGDAARG